MPSSGSRSSKGFQFEADDAARPVLCRDVRGFPAAHEAAADPSRPRPDRLVLVVPDLAMDDWLARWADDVGHARRTLTITRRTDGKRVRIAATLLTYGYGVDTVLGVERIDEELSSVAPPESERAPLRSGVQPIVEVERGAPGALRRRIERG